MISSSVRLVGFERRRRLILEVEEDFVGCFKRHKAMAKEQREEEQQQAQRRGGHDMTLWE